MLKINETKIIKNKASSTIEIGLILSKLISFRYDKAKKKCETIKDIPPATNHLSPARIKNKSPNQENNRAKTTVIDILSAVDI